MAATEFRMDGSLARAARHLCQVSTKTIGKHSGLDPSALRQYEKGGDSLTPDELRRLTESLIYFGARFIPEDEFGGVGVRRKFTRASVVRIETWEGEGGPVGEDDI